MALQTAINKASSWVVGAIDETYGSNCPWSLYEEEVLEKLASALQKSHPKLCVQPVQEHLN